MARILPVSHSEFSYGSRQAGLEVLCAKIVDLSVNMSSKKCKSSCPFASSKKAQQRKMSWKKVSKLG